jgi:hypothetical protein
LRGGKDGPYYASEYVAFAEALLRKTHILNGIVIDCSHANSHKAKRQREAYLTLPTRYVPATPASPAIRKLYQGRQAEHWCGGRIEIRRFIDG